VLGTVSQSLGKRLRLTASHEATIARATMPTVATLIDRSARCVSSDGSANDLRSALVRR
jgi:hypothetical protein